VLSFVLDIQEVAKGGVMIDLMEEANIIAQMQENDAEATEIVKHLIYECNWVLAKVSPLTNVA